MGFITDQPCRTERKMEKVERSYRSELKIVGVTCNTMVLVSNILVSIPTLALSTWVTLGKLPGPTRP